MSKKNVSICAFIGLFVCIFSAVVLHRAQLYAYSHLVVCIWNEQMCLSVCVPACDCVCAYYRVNNMNALSFRPCFFVALLLRLSSSTFVSIFVLTLYPFALNQIIIKENTESKHKWMKENDVKNRQIVLYLQHTALNACMHMYCYWYLYHAIFRHRYTQIASNLWN